MNYLAIHYDHANDTTYNIPALMEDTWEPVTVADLIDELEYLMDKGKINKDTPVLWCDDSPFGYMFGNINVYVADEKGRMS